MIGTRSNATVEYIPQSDPALDRSSPSFNFAKYLETFDRSHLPVKAGSDPTVFTLRRLTRKRFTAISGMPKHEQAEAVVAYGVVGIAGWREPNGNRLLPEFEGTGGVDQHLTAATLDAIFSPTLFAELSTAVVLLTELDPLADRRSGSSPG